VTQQSQQHGKERFFVLQDQHNLHLKGDLPEEFWFSQVSLASSFP